MNKTLSSTIFAAALLALAGCDNYDDRYTAEYASVVRLEQFGENELTAWTINETEAYNISVLRSGHNINTPVKATVRAMTDDEWQKYAATYGLGRFFKIPDDCFNFDGNAGGCTLDFAAGQNVAETSVTILSGKLGDFNKTLPAPGDGEQNIICLPIVLETDRGSVLPSQNTLLLKLTSKEATLTLSSAGFEKISCLATSAAITKEYAITLSCDNRWGFTVDLANSSDLLAAYNAANDTRYTLMNPAACEVLDGETWKPWADTRLEFPAGTNSRTVTVRIDPSKVGMMDAFALKVSQPTINVAYDAEKLQTVLAVQVKPSNQRIKISSANISASTDDGKHTAKNLVDGKRNTYYSSNPEVHDGDAVYGSYVDMTLPSPVRYFAFDYMSRFDYFGDGTGIPNEVDIYASVDGTAWEKCGHISGMRRDFNNMSQTVTYGNFDAGKQVTHIRWAVIKGGAAGNTDHREAATNAHWTATALYIFGK